MNSVSLRPIVAPIIGAAICFAATQSSTALKDPTVAQFAAQGGKPVRHRGMGPVEIRITRWSTDEELQDLRAALSEIAPKTILAGLSESAAEAGILMMPGMQGLGERVGCGGR